MGHAPFTVCRLIPRTSYVAVTAAATEVRRHWRTILVAGVMGTLATVMVGAARTLASESGAGVAALSLPPVPSGGPVLTAHRDARPPAATQAKAVADVLAVLQVVAWFGFIIAALSILTSAAGEHGVRATEYAIQRTVGAPIAVLRRVILLEQSVAAVATVGVGLLGGVALLFVGSRDWPGRLESFMSIAAVLLPALMALLIFTGAAGTIGGAIRDRFMVAPPRAEVRLLVPTCQVAATVAVMMATAAVLWPSREYVSTSLAPEKGVVSWVDSGIADSRVRAAKYAALREKLQGQAGMTTVSLASGGALMGIGTTSVVTVDCGRCALAGVAMRWQSVPAVVHAVSAGELEALAARPVAGRLLEDGDRLGARKVAVVSHSLARAHFDDGSGIGRWLILPSEEDGSGYVVVGVVDDVRPTGVGGPSQPLPSVYLSVLQEAPPTVELLARGADTAAIAAAIRRAVPDVLGPRARIRTLMSETAYHAIQRRAVMWFGKATGTAAIGVLVLALLGTIASAAAWARSVAWELSLRRAVGARRYHIVKIVLARMGRILAGGAGGGVLVYGLVLAPELQRLLPGVALPPPLTSAALVAVPLLLALVTGTAAGLRVLLSQSPATILS